MPKPNLAKQNALYAGINRNMPKRFRSLGQNQAKAVKAIASKVVQKNIETKSKTKQVNEVIVGSNDANPHTTLLNDIGKGTSDDQRIGTSVQVRGVKLRQLCHNIKWTNGSGDDVQHEVIVRQCIVRLRNSDTATHVKEFFISDGDTYSFIVANEKERYYLPLNRRNVDVLWEKTSKLGRASGYTNNFNSNKLINKYIKNRRKLLFRTNSPEDGENTPVDEYYHYLWIVNCNMDTTDADDQGKIELTQETTFYYKDG